MSIMSTSQGQNEVKPSALKQGETGIVYDSLFSQYERKVKEVDYLNHKVLKLESKLMSRKTYVGKTSTIKCAISWSILRGGKEGQTRRREDEQRRWKRKVRIEEEERWKTVGKRAQVESVNNIT